MKMTNGEEAGIPARLTELDNDDTKLLINLLKKVTTTATNNNQQKKKKTKKNPKKNNNKGEKKGRGEVVRRVRGEKTNVLYRAVDTSCAKQTSHSTWLGHVDRNICRLSGDNSFSFRDRV